MHGRCTLSLVLAALLLVAGCKSGSANADEVMSERTQSAEAPEGSAQQDGAKSEQDVEEEGSSRSVIRLFDEDEVGESDGGPVEIGGASDTSVKLTVDQSSCEAFASSMKASVAKLDATCQSDADCAVLPMPCALGCGRAVRAYSNLDQVEDFTEQFVDECPDCEKMCRIQPDWVATCVEGACVAGPPDEDTEQFPPEDPLP
ncbi:MAG: hypothetical protein ACQEVA_08935 [Myxococcota bacterium]